MSNRSVLLLLTGEKTVAEALFAYFDIMKVIVLLESFELI